MVAVLLAILPLHTIGLGHPETIRPERSGPGRLTEHHVGLSIQSRRESGSDRRGVGIRGLNVKRHEMVGALTGYRPTVDTVTGDGIAGNTAIVHRHRINRRRCGGVVAVLEFNRRQPVDIRHARGYHHVLPSRRKHRKVRHVVDRRAGVHGILTVDRTRGPEVRRKVHDPGRFDPSTVRSQQYARRTGQPADPGLDRCNIAVVHRRDEVMLDTVNAVITGSGRNQVQAA